MAKRTVVTLTDDLDGRPADETVTFGLDGRTYEIDLSAAHAEQLRKAYDPYADAGRPAGAPPPGGRRARRRRAAAS